MLKSLVGRTAVRRALLVAGALMLVACDDDDPIDPGPATTWAADLDGTGTYDAVTGSITVIANSVAFDASIEIADAPANAEFKWGIFEGTCAAPGTRIGAAALYADLEADANGDASEEAEGAGGMSPDDDYIARVTDETGQTAIVVACSALVEDDA